MKVNIVDKVIHKEPEMRRDPVDGLIALPIAFAIFILVATVLAYLNLI